MKILVLNSGSSSLKYQVIDMETDEMLVKGNYERIGQNKSFLTHKVHGEKRIFVHPAKNHEEAIKFVLERLTNPQYGVMSSLEELEAIGHRVVHGGEKFNKSVLITEEVIKEIEKCSHLAPLHNPAAVLGMKACMHILPNMKMVAVFDTAFHQTLPKEHYIYPIPYEYYQKYEIRKYGFHGTSHKYVAHRIAKLLDKPIENLKIINCHLGQGASICAIENGKSIETSMGLTPVAGIPMGTRSGDLDPSIVTFLMKKEHLNADEIETILNKESGAYGISQISVDFRDIEAEAASGNEQAVLALSVYNYQVACYILRCAIALNGVDVITFTAGVGEKGPESREAICNYLKFIGVDLDLEKNNVKGEEMEISKPNSKIKVYIVPTNEELMIAEETLEVISK